MGCEKEVKFYESGYNHYYVDKNGEIFLLKDSKKIKVEQHTIPPEKFLINDKINETKNVNWGGLDFKLGILLKYIDETCHYRITLNNNSSDKWIETDSYKRITKDTGTLFSLDLVEEDRFPIGTIDIQHTRDLNSNIISGDDYTGFTYLGEKTMSKDTFSRIKSIEIGTQIEK